MGRNRERKRRQLKCSIVAEKYVTVVNPENYHDVVYNTPKDVLVIFCHDCTLGRKEEKNKYLNVIRVLHRS